MKIRHITIIDLWTDTNRGDNALQLSLIRMLRREFPSVAITGVFRFGTNEFAAALAEVSSTVGELDDAVGGIRRTYYSAANTGRFSSLPRLALSLLSFLEALLCTACFVALGPRSAHLVGQERYRTMCSVRHADLVIWKGRNFRTYPGLSAVARALTQGSAGYFAGLLRPDFHCVNASFWPITSRVPRRLFHLAFRHCQTLSVRDSASARNARDLFGESLPVRRYADLSFDLLSTDGPRVALHVSPPKAQHVAVTLTAWGSSEEQMRYVDGLARAAERLCDLGATRFVVVPQVTRAAENSQAVVDAFAQRIRRHVPVEVIARELAITELLAAYAASRMLIGSRMHSCIFARSVGVPFVALSYDAGPKWAVLADFWDPQFVLDYLADPHAIALACETVWRRGQELVQASGPSWQRCVSAAYENVRLLDSCST